MATRGHEVLAEYFENQATWRREKAAEWPADAVRNESAARGLEQLAQYTRSLADDDERIQSLWSLGGRMEDVWIAPTGTVEDVAREVSQFCFHDSEEPCTDEDCDRFLSHLVRVCTDAGIEAAALHGELEHPEEPE